MLLSAWGPISPCQCPLALFEEARPWWSLGSASADSSARSVALRVTASFCERHSLGLRIAQDDLVLVVCNFFGEIH